MARASDDDRRPTGPPLDEVYPGTAATGPALLRKADYAFKRDCRQDVSDHLALAAALKSGNEREVKSAEAHHDLGVAESQWSAAQHAHQVLVIRQRNAPSAETSARESIVPGLSDQEAWDVAAPVRRTLHELAEAKALIGDKVFIKGNMNAVVLLAAETKAEVIAHASDRILTGKPGGGYILSTACSVAPGMEPWKLELLVPLAEEIGRY